CHTGASARPAHSDKHPLAAPFGNSLPCRRVFPKVPIEGDVPEIPSTLEDRTMRSSYLLGGLLVLAVLGSRAWVRTETPRKPDNVGRKIEALPLVDLAGKPVTLGERSALVVVFLSCECPVASSYVGIVADLARDLAEKKVAFVAVFPPDADTAEVKRQ